MTGFASHTFTFLDQKFKIDLKSLNHRYLDLKFRMPREWSALEIPLRKTIEKNLKRGSVEIWIEAVADAKSTSEARVNDEQAEFAVTVLRGLQTRFHLSDEISVRDLLSFPEVISRSSAPLIALEDAADFQKTLSTELTVALKSLVEMRAREGEQLRGALLAIVTEFKKVHAHLVAQRELLQDKLKTRIQARIEQCFEAYPTSDEKIRALLETRVAQEIAMALEKGDVQEELTRFIGHVDQIQLLLEGDGPVGKKLDFMFQELNREINTLGNKSQDLGVSEEIISLKTWVEQLREQCLNIE